jgi:hypothetical protein
VQSAVPQILKNFQTFRVTSRQISSSTSVAARNAFSQPKVKQNQNNKGNLDYEQFKQQATSNCSNEVTERFGGPLL